MRGSFPVIGRTIPVIPGPLVRRPHAAGKDGFRAGVYPAQGKPLMAGRQHSLFERESLAAQITILIDFETNAPRILCAFEFVFSQVLSVFDSTKPLILLRNFARDKNVCVIVAST
ncbi:hypothetical protein [Rhizobium sp. H4]|uniref:hypothetical protein n=2 Tax=Rhizobium TaxID=379 RepID=UPI0011439BEC|nr:hypothetical protein [Rhizobium sp. H4]